MEIVEHHELSAEFCIKYLLNPEEHGMCVEDHYISKNDILLYQKHITSEELERLLRV